MELNQEGVVLQNNQRQKTLEEPETTENFEKPRKGSKHAQESSDHLNRFILMVEEEWQRNRSGSSDQQD